MVDLWAPIDAEEGLVDETRGIEIYDPIAPEEVDILIKKHRYSGFYGTDLEIILRNSGIENVVITGVTTENGLLRVRISRARGDTRASDEAGYSTPFVLIITFEYNLDFRYIGVDWCRATVHNGGRRQIYIPEKVLTRITLRLTKP